MSAQYVDPEQLAPQGVAPAEAAERRAVKLWLVIEDEMAARRYAVDADSAWVYRNDAADHISGSYETAGPSAGCYYALRDD
jgi:hypothetical protein